VTDPQDQLLVERGGGTLILTLNRPDALNAMTVAMGERLKHELALAARDPRVRAVVITGAGRAFCAGGDTKRRGIADSADPLAAELGNDPVWNAAQMRTARMRDSGLGLLPLQTMPKPTLAMINGLAVGAGNAPALACDIRIMAQSAWLDLAYARQALSGTSGLAWYLTCIVGTARARELMFFPRRIPAEEALALGLVHRVVPDERLREEALGMARQLAAGPTLAYGHIKENLNAALVHDAATAMETEARSYVACVQSADYDEAMAALKDKREPAFKGR
jgi:2-(1,2-epoxy-1,2-dihydrophenyl)acetyl-CoA isomerase